MPPMPGCAEAELSLPEVKQIRIERPDDGSAAATQHVCNAATFGDSMTVVSDLDMSTHAKVSTPGGVA